MGQGTRLETDPARTGERGQEKAVPAEEHVLDAWNGGDAELDAVLEKPDVPRVHSDGVAGGEVVDHYLTVQLHEGEALAPEVLHPKAGAAEDAGTQALLEADSELDARQGALEAVAVDHVGGAGADLERQDLAGQLG